MSVSLLKVGTRVTINGKPQLGSGTVRFVGTTEFQTGIWVGVELDQPGNSTTMRVSALVRVTFLIVNVAQLVRTTEVSKVQDTLIVLLRMDCSFETKMPRL